MINHNGKEITVIDSHAHIWESFQGTRFGNTVIESLGYGKIRINGKVDKLVPPAFVDNKASVEILLGYMDDAGIDRSVILQNPCYGDQREYVVRCLKTYPDKLMATVGKLDPRNINDALNDIDTLTKEYSCCGIKLEIPDVPFKMDEPEYDCIWKKIMDMNLLAIIDLGWGDGEYDFDANIDRLTRLLKRYPEMRMQLAHLGVSRLWDLGQKHPYPQLQKTLHLFSINKNNLFVDTSAMPFYDQEDDYPEERNQDILKVVYEAIGPDKILWGTDFPTVLKLRTMKQCIEFITKQCNFLTHDDKVKILGQNVLKLHTS